MRIRLVIHLKNGASVSGLYSWPVALSTLKYAAAQPDFLDFDLEGYGTESR